jgi:hypothetical protein
MPEGYHNLSPILLQRFALVIIQWSQVEAHFNEILAWLLEADSGFLNLVTQNTSGATQIGWMRTLFDGRFKDGPFKTKAAALLDDIDTLRIERNGLAHGIWSPGPEMDTALVQTLKLERTEIIRDELVTLADLNDLSAELRRNPGSAQGALRT